MKIIEIIEKYIDLDIKYKVLEQPLKEKDGVPKEKNAEYIALLDKTNEDLDKVHKYYISLVDALNVEDLKKLKAEVDLKIEELKASQNSFKEQSIELKKQADEALSRDDMESNLKLNGLAFEKDDRVSFLEKSIKIFEGFSTNLQARIYMASGLSNNSHDTK